MSAVTAVTTSPFLTTPPFHSHPLLCSPLQPRFLNQRNDVVAYKNALLWSMMAEGISIVYYGTENLFSGGNDPYCREAMWPSGYNPNSDMSTFLKTINAFKLQTQCALADHTQRYSDDTFYAFSRGQAFVATTNVGQNGATQTRTITYHPYSNGQTICNLFNCGDCITVNNNQFQITLSGGMPKLYSPEVKC